MTQIVLVVLLLILAAGVLAASVLYRVSEVRADAAAWEALITRARRGGGA